MEKLNKRDCILVKLYQVISLLNCLGKVVEKLIMERLSQFCKSKAKLHKEQMRERKHQSAIDVAVLMIYKVYKTGEDKQIMEILLINVKRVFDYVSQSRLIQKIGDLSIDDDLIGWT